jgi:hypothetical protein
MSANRPAHAITFHPRPILLGYERDVEQRQALLPEVLAESSTTAMLVVELLETAVQIPVNSITQRRRVTGRRSDPRVGLCQR